MSAYLVFTKEKTIDAEELNLYTTQVRATLAGRDFNLLALYGQQEDLEGAPTEGTVILQFPTRDAALAWYNSPDYTVIREHRFKGANFHVTLVQGV
jgi:uncharacterized protein (DUF1330 family)